MDKRIRKAVRTFLIKDGKVYTLNNSNYVLIELSFYNQIVNLEDILYELKIKGLIKFFSISSYINLTS